MAYKCAVCGKSYDAIEERIACETACVEKQKREAAEAARAEAEKNRGQLLDQINASIDVTAELVRQYQNQLHENPPLVHWYNRSNAMKNWLFESFVSLF